MRREARRSRRIRRPRASARAARRCGARATPSVVSACQAERATREWLTSPTMATLQCRRSLCLRLADRQRIEQALRRMREVRLAGVQDAHVRLHVCATRPGTPGSASRITNTSTCRPAACRSCRACSRPSRARRAACRGSRRPRRAAAPRARTTRACASGLGEQVGDGDAGEALFVRRQLARAAARSSARASSRLSICALRQAFEREQVPQAIRRRVSLFESCSCQSVVRTSVPGSPRPRSRRCRRASRAVRVRPRRAHAAQPLLAPPRGPALIDQVDGQREARRRARPRSARAAVGQRARRAVGIIGLADRSRAGRRSAQTRSSARQSGPSGRCRWCERGWAVRVSVSPLATPMRRRPKSKASDYRRRCGFAAPQA